MTNLAIPQGKLTTPHKYKCVFAYPAPITRRHFFRLALAPNLCWPRLCSTVAMFLVPSVNLFSRFKRNFSVASSWVQFYTATAPPPLLLTRLKAFGEFDFSEKLVHFLPGLLVDLILKKKKRNRLLTVSLRSWLFCQLWSARQNCQLCRLTNRLPSASNNVTSGQVCFT